MPDFSGFFADRGPGLQIFYATQPFGGVTWQVWEKPRGATWVYGFAVAGAGGGGAGRTGTAATGRGGGGGGGGSGAQRFMVPAVLLPDRLYLNIGRGGAGGAFSTQAGTAGELTYVALYPNGTQALLQVFGAGGGAAGGTSGAAVAGAAGSAANILSLAPWPIVYNSTPAGGASGGTGGNASGAAGTSLTWSSGNAFPGGAGGGGTTSFDFAGGSMVSDMPAWIPTVPGGAAGSNRGQDGPFMWGPNHFGGLGGSGGGASNSGVGGAGGNGALGSGGGGGGGGTTGGIGGKGGDGFVVIVAQ